VHPTHLVAGYLSEAVERREGVGRKTQMRVDARQEEVCYGMRTPDVGTEELPVGFLLQDFRGREAFGLAQNVVFGDVVEFIPIARSLCVDDSRAQALVTEVRALVFEIVGLLFLGWEAEDFLAEFEEFSGIMEETVSVYFVVLVLILTETVAFRGVAATEIEVEKPDIAACAEEVFFFFGIVL